MPQNPFPVKVRNWSPTKKHDAAESEEDGRMTMLIRQKEVAPSEERLRSVQMSAADLRARYEDSGFGKTESPRMESNG